MPKSSKAQKQDNSENSENSVDNKVTEKKASAKTASTQKVYRYNDIKFSNVEVSELNMGGKQPLAYINYKDSKTEGKILMQSGKIVLSTHGIPALNKDGEDGFYPTDESREFIKIPLDDQPGAKELRKHLEKADEYFGSNEMRTKLFGKRAKDYEYQSLIKTPQRKPVDDDDDDEPKSKKKGKNTEQKPPVDYVKMKFNIIIEGDGKNKTRINKTKLKRVGSKEPIEATTITEIAREIGWNSEIKFIFYYSKIWANKTKAQGASVIPYGVGFKLMAIEYTPSAKKGSVNVDELDFLSEDEDNNNAEAKLDDEEDDVPKKKLSPKKPSKDEESPKKKSSKSKKLTDDDEDEDSPSDKKSKSKKSKKPTDDDDDDEDSPSDKKSKSKKSKKPTDDDDEEEEIKPQKKKKSGK